MELRSIYDPVVERCIENAVIAACKQLDRVFPGGDSEGISSGFAKEIQRCIRRQLVERGLVDPTWKEN